MSVELGFGLSSADILQQAMSREMGGWPYNDIWTQSLQKSAALPYTTAMALSEAMQHMPNFSRYMAPVNRSGSWSPLAYSCRRAIKLRHALQPHSIFLYSFFRGHRADICVRCGMPVLKGGQNCMPSTSCWDKIMVWDQAGAEKLFRLCSAPAGDIMPLLKGVQGMSLLDNGLLTSSSSSPPLGMRGHYIDTKQGHRRMSAVGVNQNKAITKRLASAGHYQQVVLCLIQIKRFLLHQARAMQPSDRQECVSQHQSAARSSAHSGWCESMLRDTPYRRLLAWF